MFWSILKKDMKRKKTMNVILIIFIILAAMFTSAGLNNFMAVTDGTERYLKKAGLGDYVAISLSESGSQSLEELLDSDKTIKSYRGEKVLFGTRDNIKSKGEKLQSENALVVQPMNNSRLIYYNEKNERIENVERGKVVVPVKFLEKNDFKVGDIFTLEYGNSSREMEIAGVMKDAFFGSSFMGNTRLIINDADYEELVKENISPQNLGEIFYIDTDDLDATDKILSEAKNLAFNMSTEKVKMCYVMEMVVAAVVLVVSICLIIVAFLVLRFTINFTILEEYREIGVMKAIGLKNGRIRGIYIVKYLVIAVIGALIGFGLSIPFGKMLLDSASRTMVLDNDLGIGINIIGSLAVIIVTTAFAYMFTGKVKKTSPVDAIRQGQTGERFRKKKGYRLGKSHSSSSLYMALNDFLSAPKRFMSMIITFTLCSLLVFVIVISADTMCSDTMADMFVSRSDLCITDVESTMKYMTADGRFGLEQFISDKEKMIEEAGMPGRCFVELQFKYKASFGDKDYSISCQQGYKTRATDYVYTEGFAPQNAHEIAITKQVVNMLGAKIGDWIEMDLGKGKEKYLITAYFQTMNNLGEIIRLHEDAPTDFANISSLFSYQISFDDHPSAKLIEERKETLSKLLNNDKVMTLGEFSADCISVVDTMRMVEKLLLVITMLVIFLTTLLMERSFVSDEKSQIAILKAIGFKDRSIVKWHMYRFGIVAIVSELLAVALAVPVANLIITPVFRIMGAESIQYLIEPVKVCFMYPVGIVIATMVIAYLTSLLTKKIKSSDTASIE